MKRKKSSVKYTRYVLHKGEYQIGERNTRTGFKGELIIRLNGSGEQRDKLALLLRYARYAGIGAKTAIGMGGILLFEMDKAKRMAAVAQ